jgi:hypothetical protein
LTVGETGAKFRCSINEFMKTTFFPRFAAFAVAVIFSAAPIYAEDSSATYPASSAAVAAPQLPYGVAPILQLSQAKVNDDTVITYIKNSGNSYGLNADQIIYLQQQGVTSAVINAMLNQPKAGVLAATPAASAPPVSAAQQTTVPAEAPVTYVQQQPATVVYYSSATPAYYYQPYCYPNYSYSGYYGSPFRYSYYPGYGWGPNVSVSFGWGGGGWHGGGFNGGGFHGGFHGGWRR